MRVGERAQIRGELERPDRIGLGKTHRCRAHHRPAALGVVQQVRARTPLADR